MRPHVLFLEALSTIAGGQRVLLDLMPALLQRFEATVLLPGHGPLAEALQAYGVPVIVAPMAAYTLVRKSWRDLASFAIETPRLSLALYHQVRRCHTELVYANSSRVFGWGTVGAWLAGRPIIWHAHNILGDSKTLALVRLLARTKTVRRVLCASESAAEQFPSQCDKVAIVPPGVDLERFAPSPESRYRVRAQLGIAADALVAGIVGDLIPLKGQDVFIQAAAQVSQSVPDAVFFIVGDERATDASRQYKSGLQSAIRNLPSAIRMLGFMPDIAGVLNALDVLVVASATETGPLVLAQALACGAPVVSTPVGWAPQLLGDGQCGELFPIGDPAALAGQLAHLLVQPDARAAMGRAARQRALERLDIHEVQAQVIAHIEASL